MYGLQKIIFRFIFIYLFIGQRKIIGCGRKWPVGGYRFNYYLHEYEEKLYCGK